MSVCVCVGEVGGGVGSCTVTVECIGGNISCTSDQGDCSRVVDTATTMGSVTCDTKTTNCY